MNKNKTLIVLIFGASGSGKSTLLKELANSSENITINTKATTRKPKKYDSDEIICVNEIDRIKYPYIYHQYGNSYGIDKEQIDHSILQGKDHFIICNDIEAIKKISKDYPNQVRSLFLLFDAPREQIEAVQKSRGINDDQISLRLAKINVLSQIFISNSDIFDGVIHNKIGALPGDMVKQVERIIDRKYSEDSIEIPFIDKSTMAEMLDIIEIIRRNLKDIAEDTSKIVQPGFVFILMAMLKSDPSLKDVHQTIKRACSRCELNANRVDDIAFTEQINEKILGNIRCAQFIVADLTHNRPNVYYEIGYAHAFKKPTILIAREGTKPHFDIQGFPIIFYDSFSDLETELINFFESYNISE